MKAQVSMLLKLIKLRQFDSLYLRNLFHEHVTIEQVWKLKYYLSKHDVIYNQQNLNIIEGL